MFPSAFSIALAIHGDGFADSVSAIVFLLEHISLLSSDRGTTRADSHSRTPDSNHEIRGNHSGNPGRATAINFRHRSIDFISNCQGNVG